MLRFYLSIYLSIDLSICLSVCLSICTVYLYVCVCECLFVSGFGWIRQSTHQRGFTGVSIGRVGLGLKIADFVRKGLKVHTYTYKHKQIQLYHFYRWISIKSVCVCMSHSCVKVRLGKIWIYCFSRNETFRCWISLCV